MSQIEEKHAQGPGTATGGNCLKARLIGVSLPALLIGGVLIGAGIVGAGPALAQQSGSAPAAAGEARISFNIPAQSLESAVTAFGMQSGFPLRIGPIMGVRASTRVNSKFASIFRSSFGSNVRDGASKTRLSPPLPV